MPLDQYEQLEVLDIGFNGIVDIAWLIVDLPHLSLLNLLGNNGISCDDVDSLREHFDDDVEIVMPENCGGVDDVVHYCDANGQNTSYEWISGVSLNEQSHLSGSDQGYGDYTSVKFDVLAGENATLELTPGFSNSSYQENWLVWIDFNSNGVFEDHEQVAQSRSNSSVTTELKIPLNAIGEVRMRVAMQWGESPVPCGGFSYGEVEDYTVMVHNL